MVRGEGVWSGVRGCGQECGGVVRGEGVWSGVWGCGQG